MRALSELHAFLIIFALSAALVGIIYPFIEAHLPRPEPPRPVKVLEANETHVVCYAPTGIDLTYWQQIGSFQCWIVPGVNETVLQPCPSLIPQGTYILITPPWLCR